MNCSSDIRQKIIQFFREGDSQREIAQRLSISQSAVSRLIKRSKKTGASIPSRKIASGRRNSLSMREIRRLKMESSAHPEWSAAQIQATVGGNCAKLSLRTMQRYLIKAGCLPYRPVKSPALTRKQMRCRYLWSLQHKDHDWEQTVFSDETYISLDQSATGQFVRRQKHQRTTLQHSKQFRPFNKKLLVWGCIDANGPGPIVIFRGTMDTEKYADILSEHILPHSCLIGTFQQDNAPPHKAKKISLLFEQNGLSVMQWPPYSPDANCIENIWSLLKNKVRVRGSKCLEELEASIIDVWKNDLSLKQACTAVVKSMPSRISSLVKARGGFIKY